METIGDAYMVVSGLPHPLIHHSLEISHLALELMDVINGVTIPHLPDERLRMRLGVHSGTTTNQIISTFVRFIGLVDFGLIVVIVEKH